MSTLAAPRNGFHAGHRNGHHAPAAPPVPTAAEVFAALAEPWPPEMIYSRPGEHGKTFFYVTWPMVARRLDDVLGPDGWESDVEPIAPVVLRGDAGDMLASPFAAKCRLTITLPDGRRLTRSSIGEGRAFKAADTDASKRAARLFGVAAYLYDDDAAGSTGESHAAEPTPSRPTGHHATPANPAANGRSHAPAASSDMPTTGKRLYGWARDHQLLDQFTRFGNERQFPPRLTDWSDSQVVEALAVIDGR